MSNGNTVETFERGLEGRGYDPLSNRPVGEGFGSVLEPAPMLPAVYLGTDSIPSDDRWGRRSQYDW